MRKQSAVLLVVILALAAVPLAACGATAKTPAGPTEVHIKLTDFKIELDRASVPAGPVKFIIQNDGAVLHEVVLENVGDVDKPFELNGRQAEAGDIDPGKNSELDWTIDTPGQYRLACHQPGHFEAGMVTTFTVVAP